MQKVNYFTAFCIRCACFINAVVTIISFNDTILLRIYRAGKVLLNVLVIILYRNKISKKDFNTDLNHKVCIVRNNCFEVRLTYRWTSAYYRIPMSLHPMGTDRDRND